MPQLAANLTLNFTELPFLERFGAVAAAGFRGVEWMFSYDIAAEAVREQLQAHALTPVLFQSPCGRLGCR